MSRVATVLPHGEFFEGEIDDFLAVCDKYFNDFYSYCTKWSEIWEILNPNMCTSENTHFNLSWEDDCSKLLNDKEFHDKVFLSNDFSNISSSLKDFLTESNNLSLKREFSREEIPVKQYFSLQGETSFDKAQEVMQFTYAFDTLLRNFYQIDDEIYHGIASHQQANEVLKQIHIDQKPILHRENMRLIDVGAGKGYLSIFAANELRIQTLPIEASLNHSCALLDRIGCLVSQKRANTDNFNIMKMCIGYVTSSTSVEAIIHNAMSYEKWIMTMLQIDKGPQRHLHKKLMLQNPTEAPLDISQVKGNQEEKPKNINGELACEIKVSDDIHENINVNDTFLVSIHACGNLSVVSHEIALTCHDCRGAVSVPCCFQHLTVDKCPLIPENNRIFEFMFKGDTMKRKDFLNHALSTYFCDHEKHKEIVSKFLPREIISAFIPPRVSVKKIKRLKDEDEVSYVQRLSQMFGGNATKEEVQARIDFTTKQIWRMMAQQTMREFFGHAFETFVLIDRLAYYAKLVKLTGKKYYVGMFDCMSPISPRAFMQFTLKIE